MGYPNFPPLQVLCLNCNCGRAKVGHGVCPHYFEGQYNYQPLNSLAKRKLLDKKAVVEYYSLGTNMCMCCGEYRLEFLTIDHIYGKKHYDSCQRKRFGYLFYRWLIKHNFPNRPKLQVLCYNCNMAKGFYKVCPHQTVTTRVA